MTVDTLTEILSFVPSLAALAGVIIAAMGLQTWRRQLLGRNEYEIARRFLRAAYKVRNEVANVRAPFVSSGEMAVAFQEAGVEPEGPTDPRGEGLALQRRVNRLDDALADLEVEGLEAEVLWGRPALDAVLRIRNLVRELKSNIRIHLRETEHPPRAFDLERYEKRMALIYGVGDEEDDFWGIILDWVGSMEDLLRPRLALTKPSKIRSIFRRFGKDGGGVSRGRERLKSGGKALPTPSGDP